MPSTSTKPIKVALYARVSTVGHGQDPEVQLQPLRRMSIDRGWNIVGEFVDVGVSGAKESRPGLDKMMDLIRSGKVQVVAVARFDRLARSVKHLLAFLDECRHHDVDFVSVSESIDTCTSVGRMVFTFLGAIGEFEKALIVERVKAGIAKAQADGVHCGRPRHDIDTRAARLLLEQGHPLRDVARMLGLPRSTLRRRLAEDGRTQFSPVHNPVEQETVDSPL